MGKRRKAREMVLKGLYAWEIAGNRPETILGDLEAESGVEPDTLEFTAALLRKTIRNREALDEEIRSVVENWEFGRMALLDRLILRLAVCELLHFGEIPPKVTINEAIDLAKVFSTEQSGQFVNGILDALYQKFRQEKRILKTGRGLVD
jgi:transcription antitermination protein NusB